LNCKKSPLTQKVLPAQGDVIIIFQGNLPKFFRNIKIEQNREKTSIREQFKEKYLKTSIHNGIFADLLKKLLTFASFCSIFYIIIISRYAVFRQRQRGAA